MIASAAVWSPQYTLTEDGFEQQFAGDHLGHFLLIKSIFPLILKARSDAFAPRIVSIASRQHTAAPIRLDDFTFADGKEYTLNGAYSNAKSANILFAKELAKRAQAKGVLAFSVHPGSELSWPSRADIFTDASTNSHLDKRI